MNFMLKTPYFKTVIIVAAIEIAVVAALLLAIVMLY